MVKPSDHIHRAIDHPWRRWYWTARWRRRAAAQLAAEPLCSRCTKAGLVVPATVAHHVVQHHGDPHLFWEGRLESVCKPCHDGPIAAQERGRGGPQAIDADGWPTGRPG